MEYEDEENPLIIHLHEAYGRAWRLDYSHPWGSVIHVLSPQPDARSVPRSLNLLGHTGPLTGAPDVRTAPGPFKRNRATAIPKA